MESTQQPIERKVTVWTPGSNGVINFTTTATTFGEIREALKKYVSLERLEYKQNRFIEGNSQISFEGDEAPLPVNISTAKGVTNDLAIILTPAKNVKSGTRSLGLKARRDDLYDTIKTLRKSDAEFRIIFKGYQNKSTDTLQRLVNKYLENALPERFDGEQESTESQYAVVKNTPEAIMEIIDKLYTIIDTLKALDFSQEEIPVIKTTEDIVAEFERMYKRFV
ncbi:MAG: hypothetical protein EOL97_12970 [Spirochaetia bacterium]|nr:hypothetical protein [Spirochaetia bacterium]